MIVDIKPTSLSGTAKFPPSKSDSHRKIIAASMALGESCIEGISECDDVGATIDCLRALGADIRTGGNNALIRGMGKRGPAASEELYVRESGSTLRFLIPLAYLNGGKSEFHGSKRLFERPMTVYRSIADRQGLTFDIGEDSLRIGGAIGGGEYRVPGNISSQFISGLLFALPCLNDDSRIIIEPPFESRPYVDMTLDTLEKFGIRAERTCDSIIDIKGGQKYLPRDIKVEGDWSGGAFLLALAMLHDGVRVEYDMSESLQGDSACKEHFQALQTGKPTIDISDCPDLGPILFAMAAYFGGATFIGTKRLRIKESDRISAMKAELEKLGARLIDDTDTVTVIGGDLHASDEVLYGHNDHRIVMSLAVLLTVLGGRIDGASAVRKSYPDFFEVLESLGAKINFEE